MFKQTVWSTKKKWDTDQSKGGGKSPQSNLLLPNTTEARNATGKATLSRRKQMRLESHAKSEPNTKDFTVSLKVRAHLSDSYSVKAEPILRATTDRPSSFFSSPKRFTKLACEYDGVFQWSATPLRKIWSHGMRSVSSQGDPICSLLRGH
jgi:hypothetical protein